MLLLLLPDWIRGAQNFNGLILRRIRQKERARRRGRYFFTYFRSAKIRKQDMDQQQDTPIEETIILTPRREKAARKFVETGDMTEAYRFAFSTVNMKRTTVNRRATEVFACPKVKARVRQLSLALEEEHKITKDKVLYQLKSILEAKITDYVKLTREIVNEPIRDKRGNIISEVTIPVERTLLTFKPFDELTESQILAIESVKQTQFGVELKLHGKSWTIERISRLLGYDAPLKTAVTDPNGDAVPSNVVVEVVTIEKKP